MPPFPDEVLTTWPSSPASSIRGTKALMPWMTPHRLTARPHPQSFRVWSQIRPSAPAPTPALLQSTCTAPYAA